MNCLPLLSCIIIHPLRLDLETAVVIALILLGEARSADAGVEAKTTAKPNHPHGESPKNESVGGWPIPPLSHFGKQRGLLLDV